MYENLSLDELRELTKRRRRAATNKVSRVKRSAGAELSGTEHDPRRDIKLTAKYNRAQLVKYLAKLNNFTSRSNAFVAGAGNIPISKATWNLYKSLETRHNAIGNTRDNEVSDYRDPITGLSIRQRDATFRPDSVQAQGRFVNRPFGQIDRKASNIAGETAAQKLIADMNKKLSKGYLPEVVSAGRKQLNMMLKEIGNSEFTDRFNKLSLHQFDSMWNYGNVQTISSFYAVLKMHTSEAARQTFHEDHSNDIRSILDWAEAIPKTVKR